MVDEAYIVQAEFPSLETTENVYVLDWPFVNPFE
jgi:hypothetical protein